IAATNIDLEEAVASGKFREDLYYRIRVIPLYIPPLRERREEIPALVRHLLYKLNQEYGRVVEDIAPDALRVLQRHSWPGNVRELENNLGRAIINMRSNETCILREHLPPLTASPHNTSASHAKAAPSPNRPLGDVLAESEKDYIALVIDSHQGNKTQAAKTLGISLRSLYYKLEKYGLR
ncbi:MAG TPA: helix-turn-helix domain-containing protein, partial [Bacillota bacterium]|nr:helix-turn-helix domain-containing protein [Bacillota bacterium]